MSSFGLPDSLLKRQLRVAYRNNLTMFMLGAVMASFGLQLGFGQQQQQQGRRGARDEALLVPMVAGGLIGQGVSYTIAGTISYVLNMMDFGLLEDRAAPVK